MRYSTSPGLPFLCSAWATSFWSQVPCSLRFTSHSHLGFVCGYLLFIYLVFLGLHSWHMEAPRLNQSCSRWPTPQPRQWRIQIICDLHSSSWQHQILNPVSKARDWICVLMDASQFCFPWARMETWWPLIDLKIFLCILVCTPSLAIMKLEVWLFFMCLFMFFLRDFIFNLCKDFVLLIFGFSSSPANMDSMDSGACLRHST